MSFKKCCLFGLICSILNGFFVGLIAGNTTDFTRGLTLVIPSVIGLTVFYIAILCCKSNWISKSISKEVFRTALCAIIEQNSFILIMANYIWKLNIFFPIRIMLWISNIIAFTGFLYFSARILKDK